MTKGICCGKCDKYGFFKSADSLMDNTLVCLINCIIAPFLLIYHSLRIYCLPCCTSTINQCCCGILFSSYGCMKCCQCIKHYDKSFPPTIESLGDIQTDVAIEWKRGQEIIYKCTKKKSNDNIEENISINHLFNKSLRAEDVHQGALGDCWLLSAVASLTSQPSLIQNAFMTKSFNPRGKYVMKLWDSAQNKYVKVSVDDYVPVDKVTGEPCFVRPEGNEMYTMIVEKVFAKFMGSYARLEGGYTLFALQTITGCPVHKFKLDRAANEWKKLYMKVTRPNPKSAIDIGFFVDAENIASEEMYHMLAKLHKDGCILAASSDGEDHTIEEGRESDSKGGIVPGHAYTILKVFRPKLQLPVFKGIRLVKMRNPWGSFEWKGDWSDESDMWDKHPAIKFEMGFHDKKSRERSDANDGEFYMSWDDFLRHFRGVDVCYTKRDLSNLHLDAKEEYGCWGPLVGCIVGCLRYWLCCFGAYFLCCTTSATKKSKITAV